MTGKPTRNVEIQELTVMIAIVIRNAMEDFHCRHLNEDQMKELNPIIRNAIYTALHAHENRNDEHAATRFINHHRRMIPSYWEQPELIPEYIRMIERDNRE